MLNLIIEKALILSNFIIYHNPRCSKSRLTLELLNKEGINPEIVLYLETPPSEDDLVLILEKLDMKARELLRKVETEYKEQNLSDPLKSEAEIIKAMVNFPKLIERPIVIHKNNAVLGRPPENVLKII